MFSAAVDLDVIKYLLFILRYEILRLLLLKFFPSDVLRRKTLRFNVFVCKEFHFNVINHSVIEQSLIQTLYHEYDEYLFHS